MPPTPPASSDVRAWAQAKGLPVGDRGRIRSDVVAAYLADTAGSAARRGAKSERTRGKASTASTAPPVPASGPKARVSRAAVARATAPEPAPAPAAEEPSAAPEAAVVAALQDRVDGLEREVAELRGALQGVTDRLDAMTQASIRRRPSLRRRLSG